MIEARQTWIFPRGGEKYVRITKHGCVMDADMHRLKPEEKHTISVCGELRRKDFMRLDLEGDDFLADVVTGHIYCAETGVSNSVHMRIVK